MAFLDSSTVTNGLLKAGLSTLNKSTKTTTTSTSSFAKTPSLTSLLSTSPSATLAKTETALVKAASAEIKSGLTSAVKSISALFGSSDTGLASTASSAFSSIFGNTNVAGASTTTTKVSDPIVTNLLGGKLPVSSGFKLTGLEAGSQTIGLSGSSTTLGSTSTTMVGTTVSTLLNRFDLDSSANLTSALTSSFANTQLTSLYPAFSTTTNPVTVSISGVTSQASNDYQIFTGQSQTLAETLGLTDLSSYYVPSTDTLIDATGNLVDTGNSGISADSANALVSLLTQIGCTINASYTSASSTNSLYTAGLTTAATYGLSDIVNQLLGCSHTSTTAGSQSLITAFTAAVGSQLTTSSQILSSISTPSVLNTPDITTALLTNPNLTRSSVGTVSSVLTTLGSSPTAALSITSASSGSYPVYDSGLISTMNASVVSGLTGTTSLTDWQTSSELLFQPDGTFSLV